MAAGKQTHLRFMGLVRRYVKTFPLSESQRRTLLQHQARLASSVDKRGHANLRIPPVNLHPFSLRRLC